MSQVKMPAPKFGTSFQQGLLKIALEDDFFASQLVRYLANDKDFKKTEIFNSTPLQIIFHCIVESVNKFKTRPSEAQVRQYIQEYAPTEQEALFATYDAILKEDTHDEEYFRNHLKTFIQQTKTALSFVKLRKTWNQNRLATPEVMQAALDDILSVEMNKPDILTLKDLSGLQAAAKIAHTRLIPTGLLKLDEDLMGGLPRETLTVVMAGTNVGKSLFCISLGCNAIRKGYRVLHVALEGMRDEAMFRYISNLASVPLRGLYRDDLTPAQTKQVESVSQYDHLLMVNNMLNAGVTFEEFAARCREIYKNFKFDMLIVDYGQLLDSSVRMENSRAVQTYVHRNLRRLGSEFDCSVVAPVQSNRAAAKEQSGFKKRKSEDELAPILRSEDIAEDYNIARTAGVIITLNRTPEEEQEGKLRIHLDKQRLDKKNITYGVYTKYAFCQLITTETYDPYAVASEGDIFEEEDEDRQSVAMAAVIRRREEEDQRKLRVKINRLIADHYDKNSSLIQEGKRFKAESSTWTDDQKSEFRKWYEEESKKRDEIIGEIKRSVSAYYPQATLELYKAAKESLKDVEKNSDISESDVKLHKEKVRHLSYLFDKKLD